MKKLREHIKRQIKTLMEGKYPTPPEIMVALRDRLQLRPLVRYVNNLKAANTIPPSYKVFLHNGQDFDLYIEQTSIVAKIGAKSYWLMDMEETNEAMKELNRLLTQPIMKNGEEDEEGMEGGGETGETGEEPAEEEPAEEEPSEEQPTD